ncbi:MAG: 3-oxoacyl-ACP synthase, partial [Actinomadura rubrobrunea]|nr:3-oxoacyl-ACP synthase [Actinomadura rubrobrunea]
MNDLIVTGLGVVTPGEDARSGPDDWFDVQARLGPRGYKYLPRAAQYLLAATREALADAGDWERGAPPEERGMTVGTDAAIAGLLADMDRAVLDDGVDGLGPATAPYFAVNAIAGRVSVEHAFKGFGVTVTSPRVAALEAVQIGARAVAAGRASLLLAAAVEEPADGRDDEAGAIALVLEPRTSARTRGARPYGICQAQAMLLPPSTLTTADGRRDGARLITRTLMQVCGGEIPPVDPVLDDSLTSAVVIDGLMAASAVVQEPAGPRRTGTGCLEPA